MKQKPFHVSVHVISGVSINGNKKKTAPTILLCEIGAAYSRKLQHGAPRMMHYHHKT